MSDDPSSGALQISSSPNFPSWLATINSSLAFSTYQLGKLFLVGIQPNGRLGIFERTFERCMGLATDDQAHSVWLASAYQIWQLTDRSLSLPEREAGFDRLYVPSHCFVTGDIDIHDMTLLGDRPVFCNTRFSCLATVSDQGSFQPYWQPKFVQRLAAEDQCHLNGLATRQGKPSHVTVCATSSTAGGWREQRIDGGCVIDIDRNEIVTRGLSMPHSPRWHDDRLYVLDSGHGFLGEINISTGEFQPIEFCPGYARGLTFCQHYAILGLSRPREKTFAGLPLDDQLKQRRATPFCGLQVVDLRTGRTTAWMKISGKADELYDVLALPGIRRPKALGLKSDEIRNNTWLQQDGKQSRWTAQVE